MRRSTLVLLVLVLVGATPSGARAQALKLDTLQFPTASIVGPWVSYRVRTQFRSSAPREYTQRVAIVAREKYRGQDGFWVELKTEGLPSGKRIERGFFTIIDTANERRLMNPELAALPPESLTIQLPLSVRLVRYQVLTSGGKLYEYPVSTASQPRSGSDVSTVELIEYDSSTPAARDTLGPDTLRIGRRVVPTIVERSRMNGSDTWALPGDKGHMNRPLLTQTFWRNPAVPITGFAKSLFQVTMERVPVALADSGSAAAGGVSGDGDLPPPMPGARAAARRDSLARADSSGTAPQYVTQTELLLIDLGADAMPEVTQVPEEAQSPSDSPEAPH